MRVGKGCTYPIARFDSTLTRLYQNSKLPVAKRPRPIISWSHRKKQVLSDPPSFDIDTFANQMREWWTSLMPGWRLPPAGCDTAETKWPLRRAVPDDEPWLKVRKSGPGGIFLVLLGLSWWRLRSVHGQSSRREYASVVEDVAWVLKEVVKDLVPFTDRDRSTSNAAAPTAAPAAPAVHDLEAPATSRHGRELRPSKRKLGSSGASPDRPAKRARI